MKKTTPTYVPSVMTAGEIFAEIFHFTKFMKCTPQKLYSMLAQHDCKVKKQDRLE